MILVVKPKKMSNTEGKAVVAASMGTRLIKIKAISTRGYGHNY
jgi:hypothetical protein